MILGDTCTRRCGFCNVKTGKPTWNDPLEPARVARPVARMGLRHAVITSVDRDDLPDYGAQAWVRLIRQIRGRRRGARSRCLTPDFRGQEMPLAKVIAERPDVFNHNVEVVAAAVPDRPARLDVGALAAGAGERQGARRRRGPDEVRPDGRARRDHEEMVDALGELRAHGVQIITIGQYLRPTERHLPVVRYWHPDEFTALEAAAYALGFEHVAAGRSYARPTTPTSTSRRTSPARARSPPARRVAGSAPCSRSRTTSRPTTSRSSRSLLIVVNVLVYFFLQDGGAGFRRGRRHRSSTTGRSPTR